MVFENSQFNLPTKFPFTFPRAYLHCKESIRKFQIIFFTMTWWLLLEAKPTDRQKLTFETAE
jgi:hypothetical protein